MTLDRYDDVLMARWNAITVRDVVDGRGQSRTYNTVSTGC